MDGTQKSPASGAATPASSPAPSSTPTPQHAYDPPSLVEPSVTTAVTLPEPAPDAPSDEKQDAVPLQSSQAATVEPAPILESSNESPTNNSENESQEDGGFYRASDDGEESSDTASLLASRARSNEIAPVEWTSSGEAFQAHAGNWRTRMIALAVVGGVLIFLITRSYLTAIVIVVAGVLFAVLGSRAPRPIDYRLDSRGIAVGRKQFGYGEFRAFSVSHSTNAVNLVPLKRFAPIMVLRYEPAMSDEIMKVLSAHLPMESVRNDAVDAFVNKLKI